MTSANKRLWLFVDLVELSFINKIFIKQKILVFKTPQQMQARER